MSCWEGTAACAVNMGMSRGVQSAVTYMILRVIPVATAVLRIPTPTFAMELQTSRFVNIDSILQEKKKQYSPLLGS